MNYYEIYREMISLRGLSAHTLKSYSTYIRSYLEYVSRFLHKDPADVSWQELRDYIKWLQGSRSLSDRTINAAISQLRFFTLYVLHKPWDHYELPMRRFDSYLPFVPSKEEIRELLSAVTDPKVKAMIVLMYSSGLRIGEVCNLRYEDISRKNMRIHITHGKNRSDRYAILSDAALKVLTDYWFSCGRPTGYLFPKQSGKDLPIDTFFVGRHITEAEKKLGWDQHITCHSLRHAFGTHLYEDGVDLLTIKALLGHKSLNSTTIYVHLSSKKLCSVKSPFDSLGIL